MTTVLQTFLTIHLDKMFTPATFAYLSNADSMAVVPSEPVTAQQALHRALADNSVTRGWEPQHRIQFFHSRNDMVVPFSNYLAFRDAHPDGEGNIYRVNDDFSKEDHINAATIFFLELYITNSFASHFQWISEGVTPTAIDAKHLTVTEHPIHNDANWYTLDGRRISNKPIAKRVYIHCGKKYVIR